MTNQLRYSLCVLLLAYPLASLWIGTTICNSELVLAWLAKNKWAEPPLEITCFVATIATMGNYVVACISICEYKQKKP